MKRFNKQTGKWESYQPGTRNYPELEPVLEQQLKLILPSSDNMMSYWPVRAILRDGSIHDRVYLANAEDFIKFWGVWPGDDSGKSEIPIAEVISISESASRLPPFLANKLYRAGESGMGYVVFEILYLDGTRSAHISGNAVDFINLPAGKTLSDITDVTPHAGRDSNSRLPAPEYTWCLFGTEKRRSFFASLFRK